MAAGGTHKSTHEGQASTADSLEMRRALGASLKAGAGGVLVEREADKGGEPSEFITADQRPDFVPFITRAAYGRFATRASKSKNARDTA